MIGETARFFCIATHTALSPFFIVSLIGFVFVLVTLSGKSSQGPATLCAQNCSLSGDQSPVSFTHPPANTETISAFRGVRAKTLDPQLVQKWRFSGCLDCVPVSAYDFRDSWPERRVKV